MSRISRIQQTFSAKGPFSTQDVRDLIINVTGGLIFIAWSYGSFWALSTFETSQQCLWEVLNERLWASQMLRLWVKCFRPGSAWTDTPGREQQARPEDSSSSSPASIHRWTRSRCACSGASCHIPLPTASPSQFSWTVTKPGLNPFSRSPHLLRTLFATLTSKKDVPVHDLFLISLSPFTLFHESCTKYHMFAQSAEGRWKFNTNARLK